LTIDAGMNVPVGPDGLPLANDSSDDEHDDDDEEEEGYKAPPVSTTETPVFTPPVSTTETPVSTTEATPMADVEKQVELPPIS